MEYQLQKKKLYVAKDERPLSKLQRNYQTDWMGYWNDWHDRLIIRRNDCFDRATKSIYGRILFPVVER